jgi:hypothetical protein
MNRDGRKVLTFEEARAVGTFAERSRWGCETFSLSLRCKARMNEDMAWRYNSGQQKNGKSDRSVQARFSVVITSIAKRSSLRTFVR